MSQQLYPIEPCGNYANDTPCVIDDPIVEGQWELDLRLNRLYWSANQFKIYGYEPMNTELDIKFFVENTTHATDTSRVLKVIAESIRNHEEYSFKRRIIKKNNSLGFAETKAIIQRKHGEPILIKGITREISGELYKGEYDYNDPMFFKKMFNNYRKAIFRETLRMVGSIELAEDLTQEIFLKAWNNMSSYNKLKGELYTWLIQICRNHCIDYFRSKEYKKGKKSLSLELLSKDIAYDEYYEVGKMTIVNLLSKLPPDQKELIELLFIEGYSQSQVANLKKIPIGTIKTRSRCALKYLKEMAYSGS